MPRIRLIPLLRRARELYVEQGILPPLESESDAQDYTARVGNAPYRIVVGAEALYVESEYGRTGSVAIMPGEGPEEVRALGMILAAGLAQLWRARAEDR